MVEKESKSHHKHTKFKKLFITIFLLLILAISIGIIYLNNNERLVNSTQNSEQVLVFPNDNDPFELKVIDLDINSRLAISYIQNGELDKIKEEFGANFTIKNEIITFDEMDIPELGISKDNFKLEPNSPIFLTSAWLNDLKNEFTLYYFVTQEGSDSSTQIMVQYMRGKSETWNLSNIRTNH